LIKQQITIGWKVSTLNLDLASLRYRAILPMLALERFGIKGKIFNKPNRDSLIGLDALVIVKSFTFEDYWLAQEAVKMKVPVIFDLCDNIFIGHYAKKNPISPSTIFLLIADIATAIVVTTDPLATIVREKTLGQTPVYIIPDGIITPMLLATAKKRLRLLQLYKSLHQIIINNVISRLVRKGKGKLYILMTAPLNGISRSSLLKNVIKKIGKHSRHYLNWRFWATRTYHHYKQLRAHVAGRAHRLTSNTKPTSVSKAEKSAPHTGQPLVASSSSRKIVWFGNHGADHADFGMLDLLSIREPLERLASEFPLELVVISNNLKKFNNHISQIAIPSRYIEWSNESMTDHLRNADVVVIPSSLDDFSICKSANRTILALSHGVPVVATATPALETLRKCIEVDDFEGGLRLYLTDADHVKRHVQKGQECIEQLYGQQTIGQLWNNVINEAIQAQGKTDIYESPELIIAIHLPQDIDLAKPILEAAQQHGLRCVIWTSLAAVQRWPQLLKWIQGLDLGWNIFPVDLKDFDKSMFPDSVYALVTITETSLNPHQFTHQLTKLANSAGIYTATMQHGYENVGLSYSDELQDIKHIKFAAHQIFTWGHLETLHTEICLKTKLKCYPVGCPKPDVVEQASINDWDWNGRPVIGIFENLHWHRYSEEYREFFLGGVSHVAKAFPGVVFLIKSHNAGMWLTGRYDGKLPEMDNLILIDPKDPQWSSITAPQLFGHLVGVITTPSTVALDAARIKIPIAVVSQEIDLENYKPLPLIHSMEDWIDFVTLAINSSERECLQEKSQQFVDRVLLPGNAASRIVEIIMSHKENRKKRNAA